MALVDLQNITVSSQSPTFQYSPARDGPINTGWNVTYTGNNDSTYALQTLGRGETSHRTSLLGAYVELDWTGTAVYVYGSAASNSSYQLAVDGISFPAVADLTQGFLGSILGLTYGAHTLRVTTQDSQLFSVQGATLTIGILHGGQTVSNQTIPMTVANSTGDYNFDQFYSFGYSGRGTRPWAVGLPENSFTPDGAPLPLTPQAVTFNDGDYFTFELKKTTAFFLYGSLNWDHDEFTVIFKPPQNLGDVEQQTLNHSSRYLDLTTMLYFKTGLDPNATYDLSFVNVGDGKAFAIRSMDLWQTGHLPENKGSPSLDTSVNLSAGAIAGITVGGVAVFVILAFGLFFLLRNQRRRRRSRMLVPFDANSSRTSFMQPPQVAPYPYDPYIPYDPYAGVAEMTQTPLGSNPSLPALVPVRPPPSPRPAKMALTPTIPTTSDLYHSSSRSSQPPSSSVQETDAGRVNLNLDSAPPGYNPAWQTE